MFVTVEQLSEQQSALPKQGLLIPEQHLPVVHGAPVQHIIVEQSSFRVHGPMAGPIGWQVWSLHCQFVSWQSL
jgi:hypothetical protein